MPPDVEAGDLARATRDALGPQGALAQADPQFVERDVQQQLAAAVADAVDSHATLVAEAGTGVGKTFAYLVPLLLSGRRALVSTATKSLQDQLFLRDLPRLRDALRVPVRIALLKGRSSYLCLHRLQQARETGTLPDRFAVRALARIETWAPGTRTGDLAEIDGLDERSPVIPLVTSTRDNCLGQECPEFVNCHVVKARREAMAADLVVVNHHLFFADLSLRDSGVAELLPTVEAAVFDEAHQLVETGLQFLGTLLSTNQVIDFGRDLLAAGLSHARGQVDWQQVAGGLDRAARELRLACAGPLRDIKGILKLRWDERSRDAAFSDALTGLATAADAARDAARLVEATAPDFTRLVERGERIARLAHAFAMPAAPDRVRWIDLGSRDARLVDSPLHIRDLFTEQRALAPRAWIFTSATLGSDDDLSWFTESAALEDARKLRVGSPFDYPAHARTWVPPRFPKPNEASHPAAVGALAARLAGRLGGRTFVLTTTLRVLPVIAEALTEAAAAAGTPLVVLVQGTHPKRSLLQRFLDTPNSVLVGSASFWEGIDVPGAALQCVVIDKLPFPPPHDPLVQARSKELESRGRDPFNDYYLSEAAIALKQGAGRLIRSETDLGLLVITDPRLRQMPYGRKLRAALPPMGTLDTEADALAWLDSIAAVNAAS
ncbi:ATP-dependent DNA helicase [Pseudaquabacterium pictum]|uniref:ATP-dependent helicase n=1 Tax=Pseudaquabacterium pictum TaxID=2315236 RepID=A0A480AX42_9BURK|nr:ATP-dependent DNA helicase [Rubrivivax pictus]GCL66289.1 ATP-dependent helicase [Rubrivivax pictus]